MRQIIWAIGLAFMLIGHTWIAQSDSVPFWLPGITAGAIFLAVVFTAPRGLE